MSVYITFDETPGQQLASNSGWSDFGRWVETLDAETYPALCALWDHGEFEPVSAVLTDVRSARAASPPDDDTVASTLDLLEQALQEADQSGPVFVTT